MELLLLGEPVSADKARDMGLVNRVVPQGQVLAVALDLARRVSLGAPVALEKTKEVMVRSSGRPLDEAFAIKPSAPRKTPPWTTPRKARVPSWRSGPPVFRGRAVP